MADRNVKRAIFPKSNLSPLLLVGIAHYVSIRVYLFFAPLINRLWNLYQRTLRVLTLPYQGCCTMILVAFLWPFLICIFWFYVCIRLWEWYGWPLREVPPVVTLMGPVDVRQALPARQARPDARAKAAIAAAPTAPAAPTQAEASVVRRRNVAPAQPSAPAPSQTRTPAQTRAPALAQTPASASAAATSDATPTSTTPSQAAAGAKTSETDTTATVASGEAASASASGRAAATAATAVKPKRSARDRSPDGWFGPPPPEEGGPEPPYVPYDPDFVDPTDYLPEEELVKYKLYKRRTPFRRVP